MTSTHLLIPSSSPTPTHLCRLGPQLSPLSNPHIFHSRSTSYQAPFVDALYSDESIEDHQLAALEDDDLLDEPAHFHPLVDTDTVDEEDASDEVEDEDEDEGEGDGDGDGVGQETSVALSTGDEADESALESEPEGHLPSNRQLQPGEASSPTLDASFATSMSISTVLRSSSSSLIQPDVEDDALEVDEDWLGSIPQASYAKSSFLPAHLFVSDRQCCPPSSSPHPMDCSPPQPIPSQSRLLLSPDPFRSRPSLHRRPTPNSLLSHQNLSPASPTLSESRRTIGLRKYPSRPRILADPNLTTAPHHLNRPLPPTDVSRSLHHP